MAEEDSDSGSIMEISDFEDDDASVVTSQDEEDSDTEESCGFFSDEDPVDENWNTNTSSEVNNGKSRFPGITGENNENFILRGKCMLCSNLENVSEAALEERCQSPSAEPWCKCGKCEVVSYHMKKYDRICCHELSGVLEFMQSELNDGDDGPCPDGHHHGCITLHPKFKADVLEYGALYRSSNPHHLDKYKFRNGNDERERAHNANWAFIRWIWDRLGYGHRIMPPACVIAQIRAVHMKSAPVWYYQNFMPGKFRCEFGKHCVAAAKDTYNIK